MSPLVTAIVAGALTLALSLLLPLVVKPLLVRLGIMDVPNERSSHEKPVLRGLGLAVLIAVAVGYGVTLWGFTQTLNPWWQPMLVVLVGGIAAGLLGLAEDLRGVSVLVRSLVLLAIGVAVPLGLWALRSTDDGSALFGFIPGASEWPFAGTATTTVPLPGWALLALLPYAVLFLSSYINVANFMDGLNGISGFHGVIAGITFAAAGWFAGLPWLLAAGLVLAAGFAGFLPWNLTKPGAFLGDVGSYLLGGATAVTSFAALASGVPILATIGPMIIYFGDVGVTLVKRVRAGHKWDEPHKEHVYQRLNQLGLSHVQASGINALFTIAASVLGLVSLFVAPIWWILLLVLGLALVVLYVRMPKLLARRA